MNTILFEIKLAAAKLWINRRRSVGKTGFFGLVFAIIFTSLLFLSGSDQQMMKSIQLIKGDADCSAQTTGNVLADIQDMVAAVKKEYGAVLSDIQPGYIIEVELDGERAMTRGLANGVNAGYFSHLDQAVSWRGMVPAGFSNGVVMLEASVADALFVKLGDMVTIKWSQPKTGRANSLQLPVGGIFVGSGLLLKGQVYISLVDMQGLILEEGAVNSLRLYFASRDTEQMRQTLRGINSKFGDRVSIDSVTLDPTGGVFGVYKYYNLLIGFVVWALVLIFFVILNYSNQNVFFMEYRRRRAELATFLTYGMSPMAMRRIVAWEALFQTAAALFVGGLFTMLIVACASQFQVTDSEFADLITAIGGTRIHFEFNLGMFAGAVLAMAGIMVWSALSGANRFLKQEIRQIITGVD